MSSEFKMRNHIERISFLGIFQNFLVLGGISIKQNETVTLMERIARF